MDVWVVAAAAGAGYVAQRLKNLTKGTHGCTYSSSEIRGFNGLSGKPFESETCREMASTSEFKGEYLKMLDNYGSTSSCTVSNSNSLCSVLIDEDILGDREGRKSLDFDSVEDRDVLDESSSRQMGFCYGFRRNKSSFRSRRLKSQFIKPQTCLESCLIAQLYNEHSEFEEYTYYEYSPNKPTVRPFFVSDGKRLIGRKPRVSSLKETGDYKMEKDTYVQDKNKTVFGVPELPNLVNGVLQKKAKTEKGKQQILRSNSSVRINRKQSRPQETSDGAFLFNLGLTTGIISSFLANKREMEKMNKLLKQSENLVQDLQDELEMKDSLTVKELAMEDYESHDLHNVSYCEDGAQPLSLEEKLGKLSRDSSCKPEKECMSKIEAELEAELERLESNINSSRLEHKISNIDELNQDFVSDVIVGELTADLFGAKTGPQPYANRDGSGSSTPHSAHYPVSPRELSLRLHQLIKQRLEERVKELETALQNSQQKVKIVNSPTDEKRQSVDRPVVINLSGEALSAYNEAYKEFNKLSDSDEEDSRLGFGTSDHQEIFHGCKQVIDWVGNGRVNGYAAHSIFDGTPKTEISCGTRADLHDLEEDDDDDEMERMLIMQIVEKARQGSPALFKAQRSLLLSDEIEH